MSRSRAPSTRTDGPRAPIEQLILVLGDQLDLESAAFDQCDPARSVVWMVEVKQESIRIWSSKVRTTLFLSAMRHFRDALRQRGWWVDYRALGGSGDENFGGQLQAAIARWQPQELVVVEPGEWGVREELTLAARARGIPLRIVADRHFLCSREKFAAHCRGRKQLRMEYFYREMRVSTGVLMDGDAPVGGQWNFDHDNRGTFGKDGPVFLPAPLAFQPDALTRDMIADVERHFPKNPGSVAAFDWPVTAEQAQDALTDFVTHRLADFGQYQDAMWSNEPWLYHSRLSAALNLKLLHPRAVIDAAERAYREGRAPLSSVEGFIRQILGWREYVRGIYWQNMPGYVERNALGATQPLPAFYWTGETDLACLRDALRQTLQLGYAHHIQRLMVTGLFSLLVGIDPKQVHAWYLAVYVDAVEWVELPNTLGMSQYADGGVMASKPYVASGKYLQRMSNHCAGCRYDPAVSTGPRACPFTTLYWDFLLRHETSLARNPRMVMQVRNLKRLQPAEKLAIQQQAHAFRARLEPAT